MPGVRSGIVPVHSAQRGSQDEGLRVVLQTARGQPAVPVFVRMERHALRYPGHVLEAGHSL